VALGAVAMVAVWIGTAGPASAAGASRFDGHMSIGYSHLLIEDSPGGSMSVAAGVAYPIRPSLRLGADVGFYLLGSETIIEGSAVANVDYSMFEAALLAHWQPGRGPFTRVSFGPTLASARAELSTSGGGLAFTGYAIEEIVPGVALDLTWIAKPGPPVRAGVEFGLRQVFLEDEDWTVGSARVTVHY
jgi:hypothetical protein